MTKDLPSSTADPQALDRKVAEWLQNEGYPTEYRTANIFRKNHFWVMQGGYVESIASQEKEAKRELDVVASMTAYGEDDGLFIRVSHIVECKWSKSKPWVVFTSPETHLAPSACVTQTIGSLFGESIVWAMAGETALYDLGLFATPALGGFGGRQALSAGQDHFYSALKGVVENSYGHVAKVDRPHRQLCELPRYAEVVFPLVVVEGRLFEASFDESINDMRLQETDHVRCHWKGSVSAIAHATVDIVTLEGLNAFVQKRAQETAAFLDLMRPIAKQIAACAESKSIKDLTIKSASRGVIGLPRFLREIHTASKPTPAPTGEQA